MKLNTYRTKKRLGEISEGGIKPPLQSNLETSLKAGHYKNQEMMVIWSTLRLKL
jgi:hypothetical protein